MKCSSRIKINQQKIKQLSRAAVVSLEQTGDVLMSDIRDEQVIPMDTGNLRGESFHCNTANSQNGRISLVHSTPYARRMYFHPEYHFNKEFAENAKAKWFEDWMSGGKKPHFASEAFKELYRRNAGL